MAPDPAAPPVVVVVVTCDPGDWFDETLSSLAAQDYPNLSILVVDAASEQDPTSRVAGIVPGAFVRRLEARVGFGRATNDVLDVVEGASHFLLCHDDVALAPDAVRLLVEEAFRSNAGLVTPKVVEWARPDHLLAVGAGADRFGVVHPLVEPGELDQEQHDGVRDVFVAPGVATLVRADLFSALGGFDEVVGEQGEDLDLSWRVQLAGARIVTAPAARVRHLEATGSGLREQWSPEARRGRHLESERHRLHTVLSCYGPLHLVWMLPLTVAHSLVEAAGLAFAGRSGEAGVTVRALGSALVHPAALLRSRRRNQSHRQLPDRELARLQTGGSARLRDWARARTRRPGLPAGPAADWRPTAVGAVAVVALLLVGTRDLTVSTLPAIGGLPSPAGGVGAWWHSWWSTWRSAGLGRSGPGAPGLGVLAAIGTVLAGSTGAAEHVVVLAPLLLGPLGAHRMARPWRSPRARVVAAVAYATVPVPFDSLAHGRWSGVAAYAAAPWVVSGLGRLAGTVPHPPATARSVVGRVVGLGLVVAAVAAVAPAFVYVAVAVGAGMLLGSTLAGSATAGLRCLAVAAAAAAVAVVALLPWSASVLTDRTATFGVPGRPIGLGQLLHFHTGPVGNGALGWGLLVAAALPLFVGGAWRLASAARLWAVALVCFALAWAGGRGWVPAPAPEVLLAPAAAALSGCAALGVVAFEMDLPGYRFGWRQLASGVAAAALALAAVPVVTAAGGGRWYLPTADAGSALGLAGTGAGDYRVLWVGAPAAIPLPTYRLDGSFGWATSWDGMPDATDEWALAAGSSAGPVAADLRLAAGRLTTRLGHLLAPLAVRYLVVPDHLGPLGSGAPAVQVPAGLLAGLAAQTDLRALPGGQGYTVYEDAAWIPARAALAPAALPSAGPRRLQYLSLGRAAPVLPGGPDGGGGDVPGPSTVYSASTPGGWRLVAGGRALAGSPALGVGEAFAVGGAGRRPAVLRAPSSGADRLAQVLEVVVVAAAAGLVARDRRRRSRSAPEPVDPVWFAHEARRSHRRGRRGPGAPLAPAEDLLGEEVWSGG